MESLVPWTNQTTLHRNNAEQRARLNAFDEVIQKHHQSALEWARAFFGLWESNLWNAYAKSFSSYCSMRYGYSTRRVNQMVAAAKYMANLELIAKTTGEEVRIPKTLKEAERMLLAEGKPHPTKIDVGQISKETLSERNSQMPAKLDQQAGPVKFTKPPELPMDYRALILSIYRRLDHLSHRQDLTLEALREVVLVTSEAKKLSELASGVLPGFEVVKSSNGNRKPTLEEVKLFCAKTEVCQGDAEWFWNKMEGCGWKNGGKPVVDWCRTITAWKIAKYLPSQKMVVAPHGNGAPQKTLLQQEIERLSREAGIPT